MYLNEQIIAGSGFVFPLGSCNGLACYFHPREADPLFLLALLLSRSLIISSEGKHLYLGKDLRLL